MKNLVIVLLATTLVLANAGLGTPAITMRCDSDLNEEFYNGGCICAANAYRMWDGLCRPCPPGTTYFEQGKVCASVCTKGAVWNNH